MRNTLAATTTEDDGFREINLSGKQMFFLFMAATTVLVVAFMLGMLVGRGVRAEREETATAEALVATPPAAAERTTPATPEDADPRQAAPPTPADDADSKTGKASTPVEEPPVAVRRDRQDSKAADAAKVAAPSTAKASVENAKPSASAKSTETAATKAGASDSGKATTNTKRATDTPTPASATPKATPAAAAAAPPAAPKVAAPAAAAPSASSTDRSGFAVQVAAVNARSEADTIVKRLAGKGYPAYVEVPKGSASTFRVRVGTYVTRHEAQDIADKLKNEEKFKPWVTR